MGWIFPTLVLLTGFGVIAGIIITKVLTSRGLSKYDIPENAPKVSIDKSRVKHTDGYSMGTLKAYKECSNGCIRIEFIPDDFRQGEKEKPPELQALMIKNEFIERLATGDLSSRREIISTIPRSMKDIPKKLRNTNIGEDLSLKGQQAFLERMGNEYIASGDQALHEMIISTSRLGITKQKLKEMEEENKLLKKRLISGTIEDKNE